MGTERAVATLPGIVALLAGSVGCTTFAGESLADEAGDVASTSASTGGGQGGEGGASPNDPEAYLPLIDAAELCAVVSECPLVGPSIAASTGLPLVSIDLVAGTVATSYAACLDWLATPLRAGRVGFDIQQELLYDVLPALGCEDAVARLPFQAIGVFDPRCNQVPKPAPFCDVGGVLVDCEASLATSCTSAAFIPLTTCMEASGGPRCGVATCSEDVDCAGSVTGACTDEVLTGFDCAALGLACDPDVHGACRGQGSAKSCAEDEAGQEACDSGGLATLCLGGFVAETDCEAAGLSCIDEGFATRCGDPEAACGPYETGVDVCEGQILHTCVGGQRVDVDCSDLGRPCLPADPTGLLPHSGRCAFY